ncbi:hypothetical protein ACVSQB_24385 [Bradyrhizobium elkanii]
MIKQKRIAELVGLRGSAIVLVTISVMLIDPSPSAIIYLIWRLSIFGQSASIISSSCRAF